MSRAYSLEPGAVNSGPHRNVCWHCGVVGQRSIDICSACGKAWTDPEAAVMTTSEIEDNWRRINSVENAAGYGYNIEIRPMKQTLPTDAALRKEVPIATGVLDYFPDALADVARLSRRGNEQHNPGKPLHWDRSKSTDEADCLIRHFLERGTFDVDGIRHSAKVAWRALALLQKEIEAYKEKCAKLTAEPAVPPYHGLAKPPEASARPNCPECGLCNGHSWYCSLGPAGPLAERGKGTAEGTAKNPVDAR